MSATMTAPLVLALDPFTGAPANLAFNPFASLDLGGDAVLGATIVVAAGEVSVAPGAATVTADTPAPGLVSYHLAASGAEALEDLLQALAFTYTGGLAGGGAALVFTLYVEWAGGAPAQADTLVLLGAPDAPTVLSFADPDHLPIAFDTQTFFNIFGDVTLDDADPDVVLTVAISWDGTHGALGGYAGGVLTEEADGTTTLTLTGTPADLTARLRVIGFVPMPDLAGPGTPTDTVFTVTAYDGTNEDPVAVTRTVRAVGFQNAPAMDGLLPDGVIFELPGPFGTIRFVATPSVTMNDDETLLPFATVSVIDPDAEPGLPGGQTLTAIVELVRPDDTTQWMPEAGTLGGVFGEYWDPTLGIWSFSGDRSQVEAALRALVFTPALGAGEGGSHSDTGFRLTLFDGEDTATDEGTVARVVTVSRPLVLIEQELDLGTLAEGQLSGNLWNLLVANARHLVPEAGAYLGVAGVAHPGTQGIATLDPAAFSIFFEADGFNAAAPVDRFQYTISDGRGGQVTGWARFTITGPTLPTVVGDPGDNSLTLPGWNGRVIGQQGDDTITAGGGDNRVFGGWGDDVITAHGYGNIIEGGPGDDVIDAGEGNATVDGGAGDNSIFARGYNNLITAGDGNNLLRGPAGNTTVTFGNGANRVELDGHYNRITTGAGKDEILSGQGNSTISSGAGEDAIRLRVGYGHVVDAGEGADTVTAATAGGGGHLLGLGGGADFANLRVQSTTVQGGEGADSIIGNGNWNLLGGDAGADNITGLRSQSSTLQGGEGDDLLVAVRGQWNLLEGGIGDDSIVSGTGADTLVGGAGADSLDGGAQRDVLQGGEGNDTLNGGGGADTMTGGAGNDTYLIETGGDIVSEAGGGGHDLVRSAIGHRLGEGFEDLTLTGGGANNGWGNDLANRVAGNDAANLLGGLAGDDTLLGQAGADTLMGGRGNDLLAGGAGADVFSYGGPFDGTDTIQGFALAEDGFSLVAAGFKGGLVAGMDLAATGRFVAHASSAATSAAGVGQVIYNSSTGAVIWDVNGGSPAGQTVIAVIGTGLALTGDHFVIV
jgi:Ca2+-binding RTX toxin-like protein